MKLRRRPAVDVSGVAAEVAAEVSKALVPGLGALPAGTTTSQLADMAAAIARQQMAPGTLPDEGPYGGMFGPGVPFVPWAIDPREPGGGYDPRRSEYPVSGNLNLNRRAVPFRVLRDTADSVDIVRRCIETRKSHLLSLEWDIVLSPSALKRIMAVEKISAPGKAAQLARERYEADMARLREWWEKPDPLNDLDFASWFAMAQEEQLVVDALTINPRRNLAGEVLALELIDGGTIKPLWDRRGSTPMPPFPAYQQVLYGFPRGEWLASADADQELTTAQLVYRPRYRRTWTPYGFPEVEQALFTIDLWLKSIGWVRSEFDTGTTPDQWMMTDLNVGAGVGALSPDQLRQYEAVINASLAGNDTERHALHLLPKGFQPQQMASFMERFAPDLYEMMIKLVCMSFAVMPTEIGFSPSHGLGGKGHQEGEENSAYRKDIHPSKVWWENLFTDLSRMYLGMPRELKFAFIAYDIEDQGEAEKVSDSRTRGGRQTINEERADRGEALFDVPEADTPFIQTAAGLIWLDGSMSSMPKPAAGPPVPDTSPPEPGPTPPNNEPPLPTPPAPPPASDTGTRPAELAKFVQFTRRRAGKPWRDFDFAYLDTPLALELNDLGAAGDLEAVKARVAILGKARARHSPGRVPAATKARLVARHQVKIADAARGLLPSGSVLVAEWARREAAASHKAPAATSDDQRRARTFVREQLDDESDELDGAVDGLLEDGYAAGLDSQDVDADEVSDHQSRKGHLLASHDVIVSTALATVVALVADRVASGDAASVDAVFDPSGFARDTARVEITAALATGVRDGAQARGIERVRIVAGGEECDFCQGYDGRIMAVGDTAGMPPLHRGCQCDIESLEPEEPS